MQVIDSISYFNDLYDEGGKVHLYIHNGDYYVVGWYREDGYNLQEWELKTPVFKVAKEFFDMISCEYFGVIHLTE